MNRIRLIFLLLLCMIPAVFCPAAGSDGLPNESSSTALFFGEISEELPPNQTLPPDWQEGMLRKFSVLDIASGVMTGCTARVFLVTENAVFWCDQAYSEAVSENVINGLRQFEGEIVPLLRDTFGSEASPGIDNDPRNRNWWWNEIGIPRKAAFYLLLMGDAATPEERAGFLKIMGRSCTEPRLTGQNLVWEAGVLLMKAALEDDAAAVETMKNTIEGTVQVTEKEGLQSDGSFHLHGHMLQFGNYGLAFFDSIAFSRTPPLPGQRTRQGRRLRHSPRKP